ncbi:COQ9 family protein [Yoonia sp. 208BN28-4]|uniref:COQ9 family protein n=1 Tax=Yoonia sp. 208BN28-4 TaxID=3126505 RepID=UPI0030A9AF68
MNTPADPIKTQLLEAIVPHVAFDGWSPQAFEAAIADADITPADARAACPRGAVDLAILFHEQGDAAMVAALANSNLDGMRFRDKVAHAVRLRLNVIDDKEVVRRGTTLFALPHLAPEGAKLIWGTADAIWTALGDTSDDVNWYTKRATLSAVYGSIVLFWLGDQSAGHAETDAFIDRRIDNVMQFEQVKAGVRNNKVLGPLTAPLERMMGMIKAPSAASNMDLPGIWRDPK